MASRTMLTGGYLSDQSGRCCSCGLLSKYVRGQYLEASTEHRADGKIGELMGFSTGPAEVPRCFRMAADLEGEFLKTLVQNEANNQTTLAIINRDRRCKIWLPYERGLSPKDHWDRFEMMQLEKERRKLQIRLAELQRQAAADSKKIQEDSLLIAKALHATAEKTDHFTTRWTKAAFTLAAVGVALVALAYVFPELGRHLGEWIDRMLGYPLGR